MGRKPAALLGILLASLALVLGLGTGWDAAAGAAHPQHQVLAEDKGPTGGFPLAP
ncbi:hypothetical protein [Kitasatospora sp. NBC_01266]|uniref:hypothetical protein n=1 Tax=Kitasatospora sp. NBC_01266 TaxID=2903572 RepID=UPI002E301FA3|nr:hypothetical protein [Kitasatospora sp. NBC_01266]